MAKKYNNNSTAFKDWTTSKLKKEAIAYHNIIYVLESFATRDCLVYDGILNELEKRGIYPKTSLVF